MIEASLRTKVQPLFDRLCHALPVSITPNRLTLAACLLGIIAGMCIALHHLHFALFLMWLSGLCDVLDGTRARQTASGKPVGAYIDLISDRTVEAAVIIGFAFAFPQHGFAYLMFVIGVLLHFSTFLAASTVFANTGSKSIHYDHSLIERFEAFIGFTCMLIFPEHISLILTVLNILIFYSAGSRFAKVLKQTVFTHE